MEPLGTLRIGDLDFTVIRVRPIQGVLQIQAHRAGPAELAVRRAEWLAPDGSLICAFEPFRVSEDYAADARHPKTANVTVIQDIKITDVETVDRPSMAGFSALP
jgi:hypothetical protein